MAQTCVACLDEYTVIIKLQCGCIYCYPCTRCFLSNILQDQTLYPWRCCTITVERDIIAPALTDSLARDLDARHMQYQEQLNLIPRCAWEGCNTVFTHDRMSNTRAFCHRCFRHTCLICRGESHADHHCPEGQDGMESRELSNLGQGEHLQRCYQCRALVQKDYGCNHMT